MNTASYPHLYSSSQFVVKPPKTELISGITTLPSSMPPIHHLIDFSITPEILHLSPFCPAYHLSSLSPFRLRLDLNLVETISYLNHTDPSILQTYITSLPKHLDINLPPLVEGISTYELFTSHALYVLPSIQTIYSSLLDGHNIYKRVMLSLTLQKVQ